MTSGWRDTRLAAWADFAGMFLALAILWDALTGNLPRYFLPVMLVALGIVVAQLAAGIPYALRWLRASRP